MLLVGALVYLCYALLALFGLVCLASGLYYLAEWVEEYTMFTKRLIRYTVFTVLGLHLALPFFEEFPYLHTGIGIVAHLFYLSLLRSFPLFELTDVRFVGSCALAVIAHFLWFHYFTQYYYPFSEILAFFVIMVWLVPFAFFLSLTANESTLPGAHTNVPSSFEDGKSRKRGRGANLLSFLHFLSRKKEEVMQQADFYPTTIKVS
ncbi:DUF396-domain-containing protein [Balamuthia mandrillaris]